MMHAGRMNAPGWMRSLDRWTSPRRLRYGFTDDGYVGLAKLFRGWARERSVWHGLEAKIEANPTRSVIDVAEATTGRSSAHNEIVAACGADLRGSRVGSRNSMHDKRIGEFFLQAG